MKIKKTNLVRILIYTSIALILIGGASFAYLNFNISGNETNLVKAGCLKIDFVEGENTYLTNTMPLSDSDGMEVSPYNYKVTNTCNLDAYYETSYNILTTSSEGNDNKIKLYLEGDNYFDPTLLTDFSSVVLSDAPADVRNSYLIDTGYLKVGESKIFSLRSWIDYNTTSFEGNVNYRIIVTATAKKAPIFSSNTIGNQIISRNIVIESSDANPNFTSISPSVSQVTGLYQTIGTNNNNTYYFRGNVNNNYIKFGTYQSDVSYTYKNSSNEDVTITHNEGDDIIWRIVRVNEDGTIKIILDDFIGTSAYNTLTNSALYTGYSYETGDSYTGSNVKEFIDTWYDTHLKPNYETYIADTGFCNDNSLTTINNISYFDSYNRIVTNKKPSLNCSNLLSTSNTGLTNPIGLLLADELALAGNVYGISNNSNYLYKNVNGWYTSSPAKYEDNIAYNFISGSNSIDTVSIDTVLAIRPVINLNSNILLSGAGTIDNAYEISRIRKSMITINPNGGIYEEKSINFVYMVDEGETIELSIPTKTDYTFVGWQVVGSDDIITNNAYTLENFNNKTLRAIWTETTTEFTYNSSYNKWVVPLTGYYKIELWGAQGGDTIYDSYSNNGGNGAYTRGTIYLTKGEVLYLYVGGKPTSVTPGTTATYAPINGGYNGGGAGMDDYDDAIAANNEAGQGGGGATDIRCFYDEISEKCVDDSENLTWSNNIGLNSRIMVAGGGGGSFNINSIVYNGFDGGTLMGIHNTSGYYPGQEYQASSGTISESLFGLGCNGLFNTYSGDIGTSGGGGGYYGGKCLSSTTASYTGDTTTRGSSGSSFISGYGGVNALSSKTDESNPRTSHTNNTIHYSNKYFIDSIMKSGINTGNGKAKITIVNKSEPRRINKKLDNVRYIKNCTNGNTINNDNHWTEFQAIYNGENIAFGKVPQVYDLSGTAVNSRANTSYTFATDGLITNVSLEAGYGASSSADAGRCMLIDLGVNSDSTDGLWDLDEIAIWNYYPDGRIYFDSNTSVSSNGSEYTTVMNYIEPETSTGKHISAYEDGKRYNVTVDLAGGSYGIITTNFTLNLYQGQTVTLAVPTKTNYTFAGWTVSGSGSSTGNTYTMSSSNDTITAKWLLTVNPYSHNGTYQTYEITNAGTYKLEVWGAQGGNGYTYTTGGGKGGYSQGTITFDNSDIGKTLYVYVGGQGTVSAATSTTRSGAGFNANAAAVTNAATAANSGGGGGGATDIRINSTSLYARVIVAGGGGGKCGYATEVYCAGGAAGGATGTRGTYQSATTTNTTYAGQGATQTAGGARGTYTTYGAAQAGGFGYGGYGGVRSTSTSYRGSGAGGGGWYGGGGGAYRYAGGGGGSGYVYTSDTAINYPAGCLLNTNYYLTNTTLLGGASSFTDFSGSTVTGHAGNGNARITIINVKY